MISSWLTLLGCTMFTRYLKGILKKFGDDVHAADETAIRLMTSSLDHKATQEEEYMRQHGMPSWMPALHLFFLRWLIFQNAIHTSVFLMQIMPKYIFKAYNWYHAAIVIFFELLPTVLIYYYYFSDLVLRGTLVTTACSTCNYSKAVGVIREDKEKRAVLLIKIMVTLMANPDLGAADHPEENDAFEDGASKLASSLEIEQISDIFDSMNVNPGIFLDPSELRQGLHEFGLNTSAYVSMSEDGEEEDIVERVVNSLQQRAKLRVIDTTTKENDILCDQPPDEHDQTQESLITRELFMEWMQGLLTVAKQAAPEDVTSFVLRRFASDKKQQFLSFADLSAMFIACLSSGPQTAMGDIEIAAMIEELDDNDDGKLQHDEISQLIRMRS